MSDIHPTAIIEDGAQIGENVTIEPYAIIKKNVILSDNVTIKAHAYIDGYTSIGEGTVIWPSASIGTQTQDLKFQGERTYVKIGKNCHIREFVTVNSSTVRDSTVEIGDECLIMAYCHIAHNSKIGNQVVMSNCATLAGHVTIGEGAIVGGFAPVHQNVRIGDYAMVGGMSRVGHDIPPFTIGAGIPYRVGGINIVGLKRRGVAMDVRNTLSRLYKIFYRSELKIDQAIEQAEEICESLPEVENWLEFCKAPSKRGIMGFQALT
ncbi:MAG: Acyl-[acyl-carrier-protein]--UDP-N-acetylglucosamine O-acyltransferase [Chlamydiae bacterium]|nr:Acyl-[acyl-carrier-protein]--UDP-N-acetylglucosamine O-acyltransferase [Chlamydiota bacterium]